MKRRFRFAGQLFAGVLSLLAIGTARGELADAQRALQQGRADDAVRLLEPVIASHADHAEAHLLLCRVFYAEEMPDRAVRECEQAAAHAPNDSMTQMWLGRAYGLKASGVGPFAGLGLAKKVRVAFERAVQLDPRNVPALVALGEFYTAAPALVGGGLDKAERTAAQLEPLSATNAHRLRGMIAEKRHDEPGAERELEAATEQGKHPDALVDLGNFYQRTHQEDKAVSILQEALAADHGHDAALMDIASILHDAHRSPELAEKALRLYLAAPNKSEAAPVFKVHVQLGNLLAERGNPGGARVEYEAALALASGYAPARKGLAGK